MTTEQLIYNTAISDGMPVQLALYIVAQSKHETGNYTHRFFTEGNNAFGYSYVSGSKWQMKAGDLADNNQPIAVYKTVEDSVHEITDWIKRRQREGKFPSDLNEIDSLTKYAQYLKNSGYYGDSLTNYLNGLVYHFSKLPELIKRNSGTVILLLAALSISLYYLLYGFKQ